MNKKNIIYPISFALVLISFLFLGRDYIQRHDSAGMVSSWIIFLLALSFTLHSYTFINYLKQRAKRNEKEKNSEDKNTILERIDDGFFAVDKNSLVTYWNKSAESLLNAKREDMIGKNLHEMFAAPDSIFYVNYQKAILENTTVRFEGFSKRTNKWFAVSAFASEDGLSVYFKDVTGRKNARDRLKESEAKYRSLFEQASEGICITDASLKFIDINPAGCSICGYSREEMLELSIGDLLISSNLEAHPIKPDELRTGNTVRNERRINRKDQSLLIVETNGRMLEDGGLLIFFRDITEKHELEDLLNKSNALARIGSWEVDLVSNTAYWSPMIKMIHEVQDDYVPEFSTAINFIKAGESRKFVIKKIEESIETGASWEGELQLITAKGKEIWIRADGDAEFIDGKCIRIYGSFQDIDTRKKAEIAIVDALEEKNIILESIGDAFFAVDKNWIVTYWNNQAEKRLSVPKNEIVGHHLWQVFSDSLDSLSYKKYHQAIETKKVIHFEDYYPALAKWYEISAYPSDSGLSVYFKDISERKASEISMNEMKENLQNHAKELALSNAELEQFAYVASHDLQEPLRMVTSFLSLLEKKYQNIIDDRGKQYIDFAVDGAKRMRQIILDLLEFSRVGRMDDSLENIDLNELVVEIQILLRKKIEDKKAEITVDSLPSLLLHRSPMRQVFQNLIDNALNYQAKDCNPVIRISCKETPQYWQFAIIDNGIGIDPEYYNKIFVIFQRLHNKDEFSGTGMGLAMTKKIIENRGGKIWVESERGKGSTFYFTLLKHY